MQLNLTFCFEGFLYNMYKVFLSILSKKGKVPMLPINYDFSN